MTCTHHRTGREVTYVMRRLGDGGTAAETTVDVIDNVTGRSVPLTHQVRHSPSGFSWGYLGSGPAELALSILWDHLGCEPTPALYQDFKVTALGPDADTDELRIGTFEIVGYIDRWKQDYPERPVSFVEAMARGH